MKKKTQKNKKEIRKNAKGITLIALVVTIIVLMILAGVAVAALMGNNGLITRAGEAKDNQRGAAVQDEVTLAIAENTATREINNTRGVTGGQKTKEDVVADLVGKGYLTADEATELETVDEITIGSITIDFSKLAGGSSGGAGGSGGGNNPSQYAPYDNPYIPTNFTHIGTENWNEGFTIKGNAGTANENDEFVWVPCVTDQTKVKQGDTVQTFGIFLAEASTPEEYGTDPNMPYWPEADRETLSNEGTSASSIRASVETYGGFYIAKYEAGITGTTDNYSLTTKTATNGSVKPLSQAEVGVWNYITRENAITVAEAMIPASTGCKSALISGECWDTTMQWMKQTTNSNYDVDSTGKGWYNDVSSNTLHTTGYYAVKNIYDMAGNVFEWTTENYSGEEGTDPVCRGGDCDYSGSNSPAASRHIRLRWWRERLLRVSSRDYKVALNPESDE